MTDLIAGYARDMQRRGLAPLTVDKRVRCLRLVTREAGFQPNRVQIEEWLDGRGLCNKSRSVWVSHLHCFFQWCLAEGHITSDPTAGIKPPRLRRNLPRPIPELDLKKALAHATPQLRVWLLLGAFQGLRCCEIAGLVRGDVMASEGLLRVVEAKGGTERMVPLHPQVLKALKAWGMPERGPLFLDRSGKKVSAGLVSHKLGEYLHGLGISSSAHTLRHYFATQVYRKSLDIRLCQELLGHRSVATTSLYASADMSKAGSVVNALGVGR